MNERLHDYSCLFRPLHIGKMRVKNRIVMCPMGTNASNGETAISDNRIDYYGRRAKGGVGMIILGTQFISPDLASGCIEGSILPNTSIPKLSVLCEKVHQYGTKICAQISCGVGRNAFPERFSKPISASAIPSALDPSVICYALTKEDIKEIMNKFTVAAKHAVAAGFDAIEIHAHVGYLVDQFLTALWNKRTDEYGGSLENRTRFAREIIDAVRAGAGKDMPILFRMSMDHRIPGGRTLEESVEILKILENCGVDAFDLDAGCYETIDYVFPTAYLGDACMSYVTQSARKAVNVPILNAGNHTPETAVDLLNKGYADFIMIGRGLIADPDFPKKLRDGQRHAIRPCIRCNEDCIGRTGAFRMAMLSCAVNPEACQERWFGLKKTEEPKKICVIGAGPAGLEAARVAAECGHTVTVYEKDMKIGGQLTAASTPEFKKQLRELLSYYSEELKRLNVVMKFGYEVHENDPKLTQFDRWIVATGATPFTPPIPGMDDEAVINVLDAHRHKELLRGNEIVICGGGLSGCDCALELANEYGKKVAIVEMMDVLAPNMNTINRASMNRMLREAGVDLYTGCKVDKVENGQVYVIRKDGEKLVLKANTIISAFGMRPNQDLYKKLEERYGWKVKNIGDSEKIGRVGLSIRAGYFAGSTMDD